MKITRTIALAAAVASFSAAAPAFATTISFDGPVATAATQTAGAWYVDRAAPDSFTGGVNYGGRTGVLEVGIDGDDFQGAGSFYNTQGRKYDLEAGVTSMTIDLFIDQAFTTGDDRRIAGFWGTTFGGPDAPAYPIIELDRVGGDLVFRGWDNNGVFFDLATLTAGDVGTWQTMKIELSGANFKYTAGGASATTSAFGTSSIGNVILQAHNTGSDFTVHWDAFGTAVPEPQTWGLMILGFGAAGSLLRRRRAVAA